MSARACPRCGVELPPSTPEGLCPACLMEQGLEVTPTPAEVETVDAASEAPTRTEAVPAGPTSKGPPLQQVGPYHLQHKLGEGGMGEVWLAEQSEPVRRRVALKIIKRGMDSKQVVGRFEAERQALALMEHPAIAKVFDAGTTPRGRPYFVMEHVRGIPITQHCDRHRLSTKDRLNLFMQVCEGVQHAHQKGIIHRDLKPSNVLVTIQDGKAVPKIIDFGVAKATEQRLAQQTVFTELGVLIGTPEYMSPEQADLSAQDIDTRTDVYSLGVLLYELLAGALPFDSRELRQAGFDEIRRKIREDDPPKPSTRLSTLGGEQTTETAKARRSDPTSLKKLLSGDLDWITMRALEKDRTRRYGSPSELAADLGRHLTHEPVLAGPPSVGYRTKKFVRRHRLGVSFAALVALLLIGFAATMAVQAQRIARERDRANDEATRANDEATRANREADTANRVSEFMARLFEIPDPGEARGNEVTAREILDKGALQIERGLKDDPLIRARMLAAMGSTYFGLGLHDKAQSMLESASRLQEGHGDALDPSLGRTLVRLAWLYDYEGGPAVETARRAVDALESALGADSPEVAGALNILATALREAGKSEESLRVTRQAREIWKANPEAVSWQTVDTLDNEATSAWQQGDCETSLALYDKAVDIFDRLTERGEYWPTTYSVLWGAGLTSCDCKRFDEGIELLQREVAVSTELLGPQHIEVATSLMTLVHCLLDAGRDSEAKSATTRVRTTIDQDAGGWGPYQRGVYAGLSRALVRLGDIDGAYEYRRRVHEFREANAQTKPPLLMSGRLQFAYVLMLLGRHDEARKQYEGAIAMFLDDVEVYRHGSQHEVEFDWKLAVMVADAGDHENARHLYEIALARAAGVFLEVELAVSRDYAELLRKMGRDAEAAAHEARAAELTTDAADAVASED